MANKLTKGMLSGAKYKENFEFEFEGEQYEVEIRALNHHEAAEVQGIIAGGVEIGRFNEVKVNAQKMAVANAEAQLKAAVIGTIDEELTEDEIKDWPSEVISKVGARVMTISGIGNPEEVKQFRKGRSGSK